MKKKRSHKAKKGNFKRLHAGQPSKYETEELLIDKISEYFGSLRLFEMPNKAGLMFHLNISRETYSQYKKKYPDTVRQANALIENAWVQRLGGTSSTGSIFYLKNAFKEDYKDRQEVEHSGGLTISKVLDNIEKENE